MACLQTPSWPSRSSRRRTWSTARQPTSCGSRTSRPPSPKALRRSTAAAKALSVRRPLLARAPRPGASNASQWDPGGGGGGGGGGGVRGSQHCVLKAAGLSASRREALRTRVRRPGHLLAFNLEGGHRPRGCGHTHNLLSADPGSWVCCAMEFRCSACGAKSMVPRAWC